MELSFIYVRWEKEGKETASSFSPTLINSYLLFKAQLRYQLPQEALLDVSGWSDKHGNTITVLYISRSLPYHILL